MNLRRVGSAVLCAPRTSPSPHQARDGAHGVTHPTLRFMEIRDLQKWTHIGTLNLGAPASLPASWCGILILISENAGWKPALPGWLMESFDVRSVTHVETMNPVG